MKSNQATSERKKHIDRFYITRPAYLPVELDATQPSVSGSVTEAKTFIEESIE